MGVKIGLSQWGNI